jgi:hypothetical protein
MCVGEKNHGMGKSVEIRYRLPQIHEQGVEVHASGKRRTVIGGRYPLAAITVGKAGAKMAADESGAAKNENLAITQNR